MHAIEFSNVTKSYIEDSKAVSDITFSVDKGEFIVILGSSGCGKTTTLRMVNKLISPDSGNIKVLGKDINEWDPIKLRRNIGYVIQNIGLIPYWTVRRNILVHYEVTGELSKMDQNEISERLEYIMDLVQLPVGFLDRHPKELSGGQQQRVGVARALIANPELVLFDEPFGALDMVTRSELQDQLTKIKSKMDTYLFVTHDILEAERLADRIMIMDKGKIIQFDTINNIKANPANGFVAKLLNL